MAKKKIDPLNRKQYSAVSAALTVSDIPAAVSFYQKVFGFSKRGIMNGPDGKPMHAELTLRGTTLMLGRESSATGRRTAKSVGASPATLYLYVENVDKVVEKATKLGATPQGPVMDMFWGRSRRHGCRSRWLQLDGRDPKAEPSAKEMKRGMEEMMKQKPPSTAAAD
jgi:PhnB protein